MNDVDWETACISAGGFSWGDLSRERWPSIRTNNFMEQPHQKSCRRFRVMGRFPANNSAMMLVCARLHHVADIQWGNKKYMGAAFADAFSESANKLANFLLKTIIFFFF